jgi:hypothetical protein
MGAPPCAKAAKPIRNVMRRHSATALLFVLLAPIIGWDSPSPARSSHVTLLYVGASDCAPCRTWQHGDGARFQQSADYPRLTYREVKSPSLRNVLNDENWPQDVRRYRERLRRDTAVPLWLVIVDDSVIAEGMGASQWKQAILPRVRALLR